MYPAFFRPFEYVILEFLENTFSPIFGFVSKANFFNVEFANALSPIYANFLFETNDARSYVL